MARVAMSYASYMKSERWSLRKTAYYRLHEKRCRGCRSVEHIDLHHRTYVRMGHELDSDLVPLCTTCHQIVHDTHRRIGGSLDAVTGRVIRQLRAQASGRAVRSRKLKRRAKVTYKDPVSAALASLEKSIDDAERRLRRNGLR